MIEVTLIPSEHATAFWPRIANHIERAAEYTYGRYTSDDILDSVTSYDHHLWVAFDPDTQVITGITITSIKQYPRKRCLDMVFCAGDEGMEWKAPMLSILRRWATDNHCDIIESSGRLGWSKIFRDDGYKALWQVYELPIDCEVLGG